MAPSVAAPLRLVALLWIALAASDAHALVFAGPPKQFAPFQGDVAASQGIAYVCTASGLQIFDASDPASGYLPLGVFPIGCAQVRVQGTTAYLVGGALWIVDVSEPASPVGLGAIALPGRPALDLDVVAGRAYVVLGTAGQAPFAPLTLWIADVTNPWALAFLGALDVVPEMPPSDAEVEVENGVAFVHSLAGPVAVDVTNPAAPAPLGPLGFFGFYADSSGTGLALHEGVLYASAAGSSGFPSVRVIDVSDPAAPVELSRFTSSCRGLELKDDLLLCFDTGELRITDVSDPAQPVHRGVLYAATPGGIVYDVALGTDFAHVSSTSILSTPQPVGNLQAVDLRVQAFPARNAVPYVSVGEYTALEVVGSHVFGGAVAIGVDVFDISNPAAPSPVGSASVSGSVRDLLAVGTTLYVGTDNNVALFDIADPANPEPITTLSSSGRSLARAGNRLYVGSTFTGTLAVYDIADPTQPALVTSVPLGSGRIEDIDLAGNVLYAATSAFGVRALDVSDPATPYLIGGFALANATTTVVSGNLLYAGGLGSGGIVLDASDPTQLAQVGTFSPAVGLRELEIRDDRLYVASGVLHVYDLTNPTAPAQLGGVYPISNFAVSPAGIAYASGSISPDTPLFAIDFGPEYAPTLPVSIDVRPGDPYNRVLVGKPGGLTVALLGSATLDVNQVDLQALALGVDRAPARFTAVAPVDPDAQDDLVAIFRTHETGIAFANTQVCLEGRQLDGRRLRGCDAIHTHTGCGGGFQTALVVPLCLPLARFARRLRRARSH
jgi:hypothetical protein